MVRGVVRHLPAQPAHHRVGAGRAGVVENIAFMRQSEMLDGVLKLVTHFVRTIGKARRSPQPSFPAPATPERSRRSRRCAGGIANDLGFDGRADIGLDDDAAGAPDKAGDPFIQ